jgi:hypothetical protein
MAHGPPSVMMTGSWTGTSSKTIRSSSWSSSGNPLRLLGRLRLFGLGLDGLGLLWLGGGHGFSFHSIGLTLVLTFRSVPDQVSSS